MIKVLVALLLVWMLIVVILPAVDIPNTVLPEDAGSISLALLFGICALAGPPCQMSLARFTSGRKPRSRRDDCKMPGFTCVRLC